MLGDVDITVVSHASAHGICSGRVALGQAFLRELLFSSFIIILIMLHTHILLHLLIEGRGDEALEFSNKVISFGERAFLFERQMIYLHCLGRTAGYM